MKDGTKGTKMIVHSFSAPYYGAASVEAMAKAIQLAPERSAESEQAKGLDFDAYGFTPDTMTPEQAGQVAEMVDKSCRACCWTDKGGRHYAIRLRPCLTRPRVWREARRDILAGYSRNTPERWLMGMMDAEARDGAPTADTIRQRIRQGVDGMVRQYVEGARSAAADAQAMANARADVEAYGAEILPPEGESLNARAREICAELAKSEQLSAMVWSHLDAQAAAKAKASTPRVMQEMWGDDV